MKKLSEIKKDHVAKIEEITCNLKLKRRLYELGFCAGESVKVLSISPLKNTFILEVKGYALAVRKDILNQIFVREI